MTNRGVIFDVDGTLVDSNYLHVLAWSRAFAQTADLLDHLDDSIIAEVVPEPVS